MVAFLATFFLVAFLATFFLVAFLAAFFLVAFLAAFFLVAFLVAFLAAFFLVDFFFALTRELEVEVFLAVLERLVATRIIYANLCIEGKPGRHRCAIVRPWSRARS